MNIAGQTDTEECVELQEPDALPAGFISACRPFTQRFIHYSECIHVQIMKLRRVAISSLFAQNNPVPTFLPQSQYPIAPLYVINYLSIIGPNIGLW